MIRLLIQKYIKALLNSPSGNSLVYSINSLLHILFQQGQKVCQLQLILSIIFPFIRSYEILAPMTNDKPTEIIREINPTERLSFSISLSTLKLGVKNSNSQ